MAGGISITPKDYETGTDIGTYGNIKWARNYNVVTVTINTGSLSTSEWRDIGLLPQGCRPSDTLYTIPWVGFDNSAYVRVLIYSDGRVKAMGTNSSINTAMSFVI